jgi:hypothetical protein
MGNGVLEYGSIGALEYWILNALLHYSITPIFAR